MREITLLDCTFRDGGYNNAWDFDSRLVKRYLRSVEAAGVDAVEMGFRIPSSKKFLGAFAFTSDEFLRDLTLPNCRIGVMVNGKEMIAHTSGPVKCVKSLFAKSEDSPVDFVRIANHFNAIPDAQPVAETLRSLGYIVIFNCMQAAGRTAEELSSAAKEIASWGVVDVLYYADSLGDMTPESTRVLIEAFRQEWKGEIGAHTHNNKGLAVINALTAMESGASWIDGTVLGMGRGAGNALTEYLLIELQKKGYSKYDPEAVFTIVMEDFDRLRQECNWGPNLLYYLAAVAKVHPTYIQEIISSFQYDTPQLMNGIKTLSDWESNSYKKDRLVTAMSGEGELVDGSWSAKGWLSNKDVLIVANGPSTKRHASAISRFIEGHSPFVVGLNCHSALPSMYIDAYAVCHFTRLLTELDRYRSLGRPVLVPWGTLNDEMRNALSGVAVLDYGIQIARNDFSIHNSSCVIPSMLVAPYAFSAVTAGGANRILLAGFDGYPVGDSRQNEMVKVFEMYKDLPDKLPVVSITPTSYPVEVSSVYCHSC